MGTGRALKRGLRASHRNHGPSEPLFIGMSPAEITVSVTMTGGADCEVLVRQIFVPSPRPGQIILWGTRGGHKNLETHRLFEG
jgi:hypothetical protein